MKIAISASDNNIKSAIDMHFGRCPWFCLYDTEACKLEFIENPVHLVPEKPGCDAVGILMKMGVKKVIAGRFGSRVAEKFRKLKIQMIIPERPYTIKQIVNLIE